jgi:hypothetical protein
LAQLQAKTFGCALAVQALPEAENHPSAKSPQIVAGIQINACANQVLSRRNGQFFRMGN